MYIKSTATTILAAAVFFMPISAANSSDVPETPPEGELQMVALASDLASYGDAHEDPLALVAAARIYGSITGKAMGKDGQLVDVEKILKKAEIFAKKERAQDHLVELIQDARTATKAWVPMTCWQYEYYCDWYGCRWRTIYYPC